MLSSVENNTPIRQFLHDSISNMPYSYLIWLYTPSGDTINNYRAETESILISRDEGIYILRTNNSFPRFSTSYELNPQNLL